MKHCDLVIFNVVEGTLCMLDHSIRKIVLPLQCFATKYCSPAVLELVLVKWLFHGNSDLPFAQWKLSI